MRNQGARVAVVTRETANGSRVMVAVRKARRVTVRTAAKGLGLDLVHASYGSVDEVYVAVLNSDIITEDTLTFA